MKPFLPLFSACLLAVTPLSATTYYVAPNGSDNNPGSLEAPWKTLQKPADTLQPGDIVFARAGTYSLTTINVSGSASGGYITFSSYPGETAIIDGSNLTPPTSDRGLLQIASQRYIIVDGFEIRNYHSTSRSRTPMGIFLRGSCRNIQIRNCNIHSITNTAGDPDDSGNAFGIAVYGTSLRAANAITLFHNEVHDLKLGTSESIAINGNVTKAKVLNNTVHDNNNIGIVFIGFERTCPDPALDQARDGICRGNLVFNISTQGNQGYPRNDYSAPGIYCDGAKSILIERNIVHHADIGVELASEHLDRLTSEITLRNNLVYLNRQTGLLLGGYANNRTGGTDRCRVTGNTFFKNDSLQWGIGEVQFRFRTSNCTLTGNIFAAGASNRLVTVPVPASNNVNNTFDYNLYSAPAGSSSAKWIWNDITRTGFAAWLAATGQDAHSLFAAPAFVNTSNTPDLHLTAASPAIDAGDPAYLPAPGETDLDGGPRIENARIDLGADEF